MISAKYRFHTFVVLLALGCCGRMIEGWKIDSLAEQPHRNIRIRRSRVEGENDAVARQSYRRQLQYTNYANNDDGTYGNNDDNGAYVNDDDDYAYGNNDDGSTYNTAKSRVYEYEQIAEAKAYDMYENSPSNWDSSEWHILIAVAAFVVCALMIICAFCFYGCMSKDGNSNSYGAGRRVTMSSKNSVPKGYREFDDDDESTIEMYDRRRGRGQRFESRRHNQNDDYDSDTTDEYTVRCSSEESAERRRDERRKREWAGTKRLRDLKEKKLREWKEKKLYELKEKKLREMKEKKLSELKEKKLRALRERELHELKDKKLSALKENELRELRVRELKEKKLRESKEKKLRELKEKKRKDRKLSSNNETSAKIMVANRSPPTTRGPAKQSNSPERGRNRPLLLDF